MNFKKILLVLGLAILNICHIEASEANSIVKPRISSSRFKILKNLIELNPELNMITPLPELISIFWINDFNFVISTLEEELNEEPNIEDLFNHHILMQKLNALNESVLENKDRMSVLYLNFSCILLAKILSQKTPNFELSKNFIRHKSTPQNIEEFKTILNDMNIAFQNKKNSDKVNISYGPGLYCLFSLINNVFVLPQVSRTGMITFKSFNDGLAFTVNSKVYALGFLGIGTNKSIYFDGTEGDSESSLSHDFGHLMLWHVQYQKNVFEDMNHIKTRIENVYNTHSVQLYFYLNFHEENISNTSFSGPVKDVFLCTLSLQQLSIDADSKCSDNWQGNIITTLKRFVELNMNDIGPRYQALLADGEYLYKKAHAGKPFPGETTIERIQSFLNFYYEGVELIKQASDANFN